MLSKYRLHSLKNELDRDPDLKREHHEILRIILKRELSKKLTMKRHQEKLIICPTEQSWDPTKKQQKFASFSTAQQRLINVHL